MVATTYTWNVIASTQVDADSPVTEDLMEAIRQNLISLEEWLGDGFAQEKNHKHDGVDSASVQPPDYTAGNYIIASDITTITIVVAVGAVKIKEFKIGSDGVLRTYFEMLGAPGTGDSVSQIYRNGGAVGTLRVSSTGVNIPYTEDIAGWSVGDTCELWAYITNTAGSHGTYKNFNICVASPLVAGRNVTLTPGV